MNQQEQKFRSVREQMELLRANQAFHEFWFGQTNTDGKLESQTVFSENQVEEVKGINDFPQLKNWLLQNQRNRDQFSRFMIADLELDQILRRRVGKVDENANGLPSDFNSQLISRLKSKVHSALSNKNSSNKNSSNTGSSKTEAGIIPVADRFQELEADNAERLRELFHVEESEWLSESEQGSNPPANGKLENSVQLKDGQGDTSSECPDKQSPAKQSSSNQRGRSSGISRRTWSIGLSATALTVAASFFIASFMRSEITEDPIIQTTEMLCQRSLDWSPNQSGEWNDDVALAPDERLYPSHLLRFRAQAWKRIEIEGDSNALVYNLIPKNDLSSLKAYVYVFKPTDDYELPMQFDSQPDANKQYKFWSVACQQEELVYVLVFEGDSKRISEIIRRQEVG